MSSKIGYVYLSGRAPPKNVDIGTARAELLKCCARDLSAVAFAHELGHAIETKHPHILAASLEFLWDRIKGDELKDLSSVHYKGGVGAEDDFHKIAPYKQGGSAAYVGRVYADKDGKWVATEVLSTGLEMLAINPIGFARVDPEYFAHVIACLRSVGSGNISRGA